MIGVSSIPSPAIRLPTSMLPHAASAVQLAELKVSFFFEQKLKVSLGLIYSP